MPAAEMALREPPPGLGSGKLGTPCERMHCANCSCCDWLASPGETEPDDPDDATVVLVVVVLLALAAPGFVAPPPHAATSSPMVASSPTRARMAPKPRRCRTLVMAWARAVSSSMMSCSFLANDGSELLYDIASNRGSTEPVTPLLPAGSHAGTVKVLERGHRTATVG